MNSLSPFLTSFTMLDFLFLQVSRSACINSKLMTSISNSGSTALLTCKTLSSSNILTISRIASVSRMCERNLLPSPSPSLAPLTSPAISTNSTTAGIVFLELESLDNCHNLSSGTSTIPTDGSIVQKG